MEKKDHDCVRASAIAASAKVQYAESAAVAIEELVRCLKGDKEFSGRLKKDPRGALEVAGIRFEKEAFEALMASQPDRFDGLVDQLFTLVDPDLVSAMVAPSCDGVIIPTDSKHQMKLRARR